MALQGLRGSGFNPVSGTSFVQQRQNSEMQAQKILDKRQEREDRKKEEEKRQKEADRLLKSEFDQLKTEATFLGLPAGRAVSMSLGSLKGWVKSAREMKVNNEKMQELLMRQQKHDAEMAEKKATIAKQQQMEKGANIAMRRGLPTPGRAQLPMPKMSLNEMMGFNQMRGEQQKAAPPSMSYKPMGLGGGILQTQGGGQPAKTEFTTPMQPVMQNGEQIGLRNPDTKRFEPTARPQMPKQSSANSSIYSQTEVDEIKKRVARLRQEIEQGAPEGYDRPSERQDWLERKEMLLDEATKQLKDMARSGVSGAQAPMQTQPTQESPQDFQQKYFTPDGKLTNNFVDEVLRLNPTEGKERKKQVVFRALANGIIDKDSARRMLESAPYPLIPNEQ